MPDHITIRIDDVTKRFTVIEALSGHEVPTERDYGRLDAAVSKAWTQAKRRRVPLQLDLDPAHLDAEGSR